jgi:uncharacterized protein (TIGR02246 family)
MLVVKRRYETRRGHIYAFVAILAMVLSGCAKPVETVEKPNTTEADKVAIGKTMDEYILAWKAADAGRIAQLYSDDAVILPGDHPAESGRAPITKYNQDFFDEYTPNTFEISTKDREIEGNWAFDSGSYSFTATAKKGGKPLEDHGKYVVIMKRQGDGSWKWFRDIDNSDGPPTPAPSTKGN